MLTYRQRIVIWCGLSALALLGLVVPWKYDPPYEGAGRYSLLFLPPGGGMSVDVVRVLIPMGVVLVATVAGVFLAKKE